LVIVDDQPAGKWDVAYPVGNGRLGAMPFGKFPEEEILINEETIWARTSDDKFLMPSDSSEHLEQVRQLEAAGDYRGADQYFQKHLQNGIDPDTYQLLGWLRIKYVDTEPLRNMRRRLDLRTGMATNVYTLGDGSTITQKVIASAVDDVIAVIISADRKLNLSISLDGGLLEEGDIVKAGSADGRNATHYVGRVRAVASGSIKSLQDTLAIQDSDRIAIYLAAATNFDRTNSGAILPEGWQSKARQDLDRLRGRASDDVVEAAVRDHQQYFGRLDLDLGRTADGIRELTTRDRLARIKQGKTDDPDLIETYVQFGRYLLIASSRPSCFPANLQGVWNPHMSAPWGSDYHLNINIQMNYWPAETTNLSEMHRPLFDLIRYYQPNGKRMARRLGMKGWCMGHATDIWGHAKIMSRTAFWGGSFFGGQWMTFHILEHYRFNRDVQFLEENWDILTASAKFVDSWLIPSDGQGQLVARPSCSPENSFIYQDQAGRDVRAALSSGNTFDQFMVLQVFHDYLEAAGALGKQEDPFVQKIEALLPRVYRPRIAGDGRLMEWRLPFREAEPGHRHISHVIGAYPGNQINLDEDREMRRAVVKSIEGRLQKGGAGTGWSRAWTIGMFARLSDGQRAYENLIAILRRSTLDNLFDSHPPFQIDGNFGATAAVAEMLLHSHNNEIRLLPALPDQWPDGHARGLRARGDFTVDIRWQDGRLVSATIHAGKHSESGPVAVRYGDTRTQVQLEPGKSVQLPR
jgi:alpha-L-fucosidase 2